MLTILAVIFPAIAGIAASILPEAAHQESKGGWGILPKISMDAVRGNRNARYALISLITAFLSLLAIFFGRPVTLIEFSENVTLRFELDALGKFFLIAVLILYTAVVFYAFEYMTMEENQNVFFAFLYVSLGALIAVCASGNLVTVYLFFEMATLTTVPLVLHEGTKPAIAAGMKYLFYSIGGALMGLFGVFFIYFYGAAGRNFQLGGFLDEAVSSGHRGMILTAVFIAIIGFGTKAGLYPMHGWLPTAHPIAPAPASALLSGIIAKAGVIAVVRLVYYSVGADYLRGTWVQMTWMILAMLTIFMGSMMAFLEKNMKKRLAFSTISQISYIMLALSTLSDTGVRGGLIHMMSHPNTKAKATLTKIAIIILKA